ncbi:MAG TPA: hypothetical protein VHY19_08505 [Steroidobacteraceae bacterium]|jgi:hypothetical protein|nr:hypothetical protein [Steroidobacteraceae bacterium]
MYTRPTAPRSIGGVLDDAVRLYRASFSHCWPLSLSGAVLASIVAVWQTRQIAALPLAALGTGGTSNASLAAMMTLMARMSRMEHSPILWLTYVLTTVVWLVFPAAIMRRQDAVADGRADSFGEALGYVLRHLPTIIIAGIVFSLAVGVGLLLLVVPCIWLWGYLQLWLVAAATEDLGPFAALGRSWKLIERHWWRTSATVTVAWIIVLVIGLVSGVVTGIAAVLFRGDLALVLAASQLLSALLNIFTMPMWTVAMVAIFRDLKMRRDGGDLAARVSSLQPA